MGNPTGKPGKKELRIKQILDFCVEPKSSAEILKMLGLKNRENLMDVYLNPMITEGLLYMTDPDNPTNRNQRHVSAK